MSLKEYTRIDPDDVAGFEKSVAQAINHDEAFAKKVATINNAADQTYSAAQVLGGLIIREGGAANNDTTPAAADIVAAIPHAAVGDSFDLDVRNDNSGTLTLVAGAGVTLEGVTTIPTVNTRRYRIELTNVGAGTEAVTVHGVSVAGH